MTGRPSASRVGVVGLGTMGAAIAEQLVNGDQWQVHGYDIVGSRTAALVAAGGYEHSSIAALTEAVDVLVLSLPSVDAFDAVADQLCADPGGGPGR